MYEHFGFELATKVLVIREFLQIIASKHAFTPDRCSLIGWHGKYRAAPRVGIDAERASACLRFADILILQI